VVTVQSVQRSYNVLCVEDDYMVRELLELALPMKCSTLNVVTAPHGLDAIAYLERNTVDLVVTDFNMPFCNGAELAEHIESSDSPVPVVVFSGDDESKLRDNVPSAVGYVSKTATRSSLDELASIVATTLQIDRV